MLTTIQDLKRTAPERQGITSSVVRQFVEALDSEIDEIHSFMLLRHGCVVAEGWWSPYAPQHPHMLFSLSKSFTSTAVGLAVDEGRFSVDDSVLSFFPDEKPAEVTDNLAAMRVRHLLSMSTGHDEDTTPHMTERSNGNWTKGFFEVPVLHEPGTHFLYNTGATYMLSAIVQKTTGMKLMDYLTPRLFEPLGIEGAFWEESPQGINAGGYGLNVITEDIARFGQLYLQKGVWQGRQILPAAWVEEATAFHVSNGDDPNSEWTQGYGYQFWRCRHNAYRGDGAFGQFCIVMPDQDAVLAITAGVADMQKPMNLVWDILLPAMDTDLLADDAAAYGALTAKLSGLALLPVEGEADSSVASNVSGQTYTVDENDQNVETIALRFAQDSFALNVKTASGDHTISGGYSTWQQGQTSLFNPPWEPTPGPYVASGAWTADDTFTVIVRLYETPFRYTMHFHFTESELRVATQVNVSFEGQKTLELKAHTA